MEELALKVDHVTKEYRLGTIGGGTLKGEIQSKVALWRGKEDPNSKIGSEYHGKNEKFIALDDVSFEIKKGEKIGIIGHNGAGKSTILKLICRVTAPTKGNIYLNGRITSMLEVGTGFHGELTGRENIYLNGSILGMSKEEIDAKFDEIVEFSEIGKFIDTPVKRYSSGMNVKLGFSVASHLNSEIMIMDEVLAVGDMAFQNKCIEQMKKVADTEGRTILYVSHNMHTIRTLCDRCIVLDHGTVRYIGDVEEAIRIYLGRKEQKLSNVFLCDDIAREEIADNGIHISQINLENVINGELSDDDLKISLLYCSKKDYKLLKFRATLFNVSDIPISMCRTSDNITTIKGENETKLTLHLPNLAPGKYSFRIAFYEIDSFGNEVVHDVIDQAFFVRKVCDVKDNKLLLHWNSKYWGNIVFPDIDVI